MDGSSHVIVTKEFGQLILKLLQATEPAGATWLAPCMHPVKPLTSLVEKEWFS